MPRMTSCPAYHRALMTVIPSGTSYFLPAISTVTIFGRRTSSWSIMFWVSMSAMHKPFRNAQGVRETSYPPHSPLFTPSLERLLCNRIHDRVQGRTRTHRFLRLRVIGMIIPADVDRLALGREQLAVDLGFVVRHLLGDLGKPGRETFVLGLLGQRLRPVQRQIKMAPAIVDFSHLAGRRL